MKENMVPGFLMAATDEPSRENKVSKEMRRRRKEEHSLQQA